MSNKKRYRLNKEQSEYIKLSLHKGFPKKLKWILDMFSGIPDEEKEDEYIIKKGKVVKGKVDDRIYLLNNDFKLATFNYKDEIEVDSSFMEIIPSKMITTLGRLITNYILIYLPFGKKGIYLNKQFTVKDIEETIIKNNLTDEPEKEPNKITIQEYHKFYNHVMYIDGMSKFLTFSATPKAVLPPPNIDSYKQKIINELKKKYGPHALENLTVVAELEKKLEEYDEQYLKDDPALGKLLSGKTKGIARKRKFLIFGVGNTFEDTGKVRPVIRSLYDEWDKNNPDDLVNLINDARSGSYSRGAETQKGGVVTKDNQRATADRKIKKGDCKTKIYLKIKITDINKDGLIGRYIVENGKLVLLNNDNIKRYINKTVNLRSPMFCKLVPHFCSICAGEIASKNENSIPAMATGVGGEILSLSLAKFHGSKLELVDLETDLIV